MKTLSILLFISVFIWNHPLKGNSPKGTPDISVLKKKKEVIDDYLAKHQSSIIEMAKLTDKPTLVKVENDKWPDDTECSYNVLKDASGKIILIGQSPFSESGDWTLEYRYYFDETGKIFAFTKEKTVSTEQVKGGLLGQLILNYYDINGKVISESNRLLDVNRKPIKGNSDLYDRLDDSYKVYKNVHECLAGYNIKL